MAKKYTREQSIIDYHRLIPLLEIRGLSAAEKKVAAAAIVEHRMLRSGGYIKQVVQLRTKIIER